MQRHPAIYFAPSELHGRGVFTAEAIPEGSVIEICPVLVLSREQLPLIHRSELYEYYFLWGKKKDLPAIVLGFGSLYNHAASPNARFLPDFSDDTLIITARRDIAAGEEITLDYHAGSEEEVWFEVE